MTRRHLWLLWALAGLLLSATTWRASRLPDPYSDGAPVGAVADRREHRFRNLTYTETQNLFQHLLQAASRASDAPVRARALARLAALQHERGLAEAADAAAREALRFAPNDPEVRRLLAAPLDLDSLP